MGCHQLVFCIERVDCDERSEDLLSRSARRRQQPSDHARGQKGTLVKLPPEGWARATTLHSASLLLGNRNITLNLVAVCEGDEGAHARVLVLRVPNLELLRVIDKVLDNPVVDTALHKHSRSTQANLPLVQERRASDGGKGLVHVSVIEHNSGVFPTKFEGDFFEQRGGSARDSLASEGATGERNARDVGVGDEGSSDIRTHAINKVAHSRRHTAVMHNQRKSISGNRCQVARLCDNCVPHHQRRCNFPGQQIQWEIPRCD
mmetsp:Transcript_13790/g.32012  ORF Transcript_13790/g.32012 Transcript_13790/m.32012 type:complete len:261 (+) Transcript_13790:595-1377(+)